MIREQFDWLAENDKRMLIIDGCDRAHAIDYATFLCFLSPEPA